jgi:transcriptional regulator of nitric oxide reductase
MKTTPELEARIKAVSVKMASAVTALRFVTDNSDVLDSKMQIEQHELEEVSRASLILSLGATKMVVLMRGDLAAALDESEAASDTLMQFAQQAREFIESQGEEPHEPPSAEILQFKQKDADGQYVFDAPPTVQ